MLAAADIDLEQVDREFEVAVRHQLDVTLEPGSDANARQDRATSAAPRGSRLAILATVGGALLGLAGTAACVVGLAAGVHTVNDLLYPIGHPDVGYDGLLTGAWLSAGTAGLCMAVWCRRTAAALTTAEVPIDRSAGNGPGTL